jgi:endoglucanase
MTVFVVTPLLAGLPLAGAQSDVPRSYWALWLGAYADGNGRVIDDANNRLSHSESQGYGMLLALAFNDRAAFARMWSWTEQNLWVRNDGLLAWAWREGPNGGGVTDLNNATDGDLLVAWALLEAAARWDVPRYRLAGGQIAQSVIDHATVEIDGHLLLRPGVEGFESANQIVNPSYWIFPALERLVVLAPAPEWSRLMASGYWLLDRLPTTYRLTPEWTAITTDGILAAPEGLDTVAGYNALRLPLYLIWAGEDGHPMVDRYQAAWAGAGDRVPTVIDNASGMPLQFSADPGYQALTALTRCARRDGPADWPEFSINQPYYPATLHLFAELVAYRRYPSCFAPS